MTFPQPNSTDAVLGGLDLWRLNTMLASAGDIYESEVGAYGFALGPNSDIAQVRVTYYDAAVPQGLQSLLITPDRNFVGFTPALCGQQYIRSNTRKGRILISSEDLYDPGWRPPDFDSDAWVQVRPELDILQYFQTPPAVMPPRSDRQFRFQYLPENPSGKSTYLSIPCYGRKSGTFKFCNRTTEEVDIIIQAVSFSTSDPAGTQPGIMSQFDSNLFTVALANDASAVYPYKASVEGTWDYFLIKLATDSYNGGPLAMDILLSDDVM